ncbi:hypothetical protein [Paenibacillus sp. MMS20-IR301]|uniref:hypothetical protein n=1 Tax=Paenibacillus sp. MMS20-IR301 TaxID=2895946 RepID=UPI0028F1172C|nr:hypothetical protein [Paenibacillus sp. MMS20-IR301]WNS45495.1 hypothetical protein LOS79_09565 [Paenibacillus sp. MMS20-IR301]
MNHRGNGHGGNQGTDEAWAKLQEKLEQEPVNPVWAAWGKQDEEMTKGSAPADSEMSADPEKLTVLHMQTAIDTKGQAKQNAGPKSRKTLRTRSRKWAAAAAGVAIFGAILATPVGNTAMAAILNQFKVQDVAVIEESDLRDIFNQVSETGNFQETMNSFGSFSISYGTVRGTLPVGDLQAVLGIGPMQGEDFAGIQSVGVDQSKEISLTLNVDKVNQALKRVGSTDLLPESVDGKLIQLKLPEIVNYDLSPDKNRWANLSQMNTPVLTVDPSIDVKEALKAVLNFPLLPDYLRSSLQESRILAGEIPMPLVKDSFSEQIEISGTPVILKQYNYNKGPIYYATWVKGGNMFMLNGGELYPDKGKFLEKVGELIAE